MSTAVAPPPPPPALALAHPQSWDGARPAPARPRVPAGPSLGHPGSGWWAPALGGQPTTPLAERGRNRLSQPTTQGPPHRELLPGRCARPPPGCYRAGADIELGPYRAAARLIRLARPRPGTVGR